MEDNCTNIKMFIDVKGELRIECVKHYCFCRDEFFEKEQNKKYQKAKKKGEAKNGIFFNK